MKKIIITLFILVSIASAPVWAGFGDDKSPFASDENTEEQVDEASNSEDNNTTDFGNDDKFSKESFGRGGGEEVMAGPPPQKPIPLDGGVSLLLLGGIGLGIKKLFGKKQ